MLSPKPWDKDAVLSLMVGLFISIFFGGLITMAINKYALGLIPPTRHLLTMAAMAIAFQGFALGWIICFLRARNLTWQDAFGFKTSGLPKAIATGLIAGIVFLIPSWGLHQVSIYLINLFPVDANPQEVVQQLQTGVPPSQQMFYFLMAVLVAPVVEELLFRGILYPSLKQSGYPRFAVWGTAILFAATHANLMSFVPLTFLGIALTYLYEDSNNLLPPILAHSTFNTINFFAIIYRTEVNDWLRSFV